MDCSACGGAVLSVPVPDDLRGHLPGDPGTATVCRSCLLVEPFDGEPADDAIGAVANLSTALPDDPEVAFALATMVTLCDSLALYRNELEALVSRIERSGIDPVLALDRLAADPDLDLLVDAERRRDQLVQLLE
jgi:hypothetical protein